jgi:polysaccharide export outer membrane protein
MGFDHRRMMAFALCILLAGCTTPRGAGFQTEVLAAAEKTPAKGEAPDFSVHPVTRDSLALLGSWPDTGARSYSWISRRAQPASMIIAPGDAVTINVWDTEPNSLLAGPGQRVAELKDVQVGPGGSVFLPFVGEMKLSGMSPQTARAKIEERYITSIPSAQVQVQVTPGRANTANLVSGVARPGIYPLTDRDITLLSLISEGGGVAPGLKNPQVRLMRGSKVYGISVARLFEEPALDTTLQGGDRVIVEEDSRYFLSLGASTGQSLYPFSKDEISALDALSIIGGVTANRADPKGILILREYPRALLRGDGVGPPQERVVFTLDLTSADGLFSAGKFAVMPGDLIYASESRITSARTVLGLIGSVFGLADQVSGN